MTAAWNRWMAWIVHRRLLHMQHERALNLWVTTTASKSIAEWRGIAAQRLLDRFKVMKMKSESIVLVPLLLDQAWSMQPNDSML